MRVYCIYISTPHHGSSPIGFCKFGTPSQLSDSQTLHTRHKNLFWEFLRFSFFFRLVNATTIFSGKEPIWPLTQGHLTNATKPDLQSIRSSTPNITVQSRHWVALCVRWTILHMNSPVTPSTFLVDLPTPVLCFNVFVSRPPLLYGCACGDCPGSWNDAIRIRPQIKLSTSK